LGVEIAPETLVSELSISQRQFVEIAHGIKADARIFILDEPTAALNAADVEVLNRQIRRLRDEGKAIVYISHRMDEIFEICDSVTVLKDGKLIGTYLLSDMTPEKLITKMVGRELQDLFPSRAQAPGEVVLDVKHFKIASTSKPFSLQLCRCEIVALAGLEGQGQQKLLRSLIGRYTAFSGTIKVKGSPLSLPVAVDSGVRQLQALGVGFIPEDRKDEGLFLGLSIAHNIDIGQHVRKNDFSLKQNTVRLVDETMAGMNVKSAGPQTPVNSLSGGNQQKVLLGRYLAANMDILLIEEPTRGVDIGAKSEIYKLLRKFANKGGAVLVLSRETIELIGLCDRIYVMHSDTLVDEMLASAATEHKILSAALAA
jgi:ribose transport system ATP-binding protein